MHSAGIQPDVLRPGPRGGMPARNQRVAATNDDDASGDDGGDDDEGDAAAAGAGGAKKKRKRSHPGRAGRRSAKGDDEPKPSNTERKMAKLKAAKEGRDGKEGKADTPKDADKPSKADKAKRKGGHTK